MNQRKAGALLSYISLAINSIIGLIYIPMLLNFLSKEQYGLYQMIGALVAYLGTMDFGLANTTTRYYSKYLATNETEKQENLLATIGILYSIIACAIIIVGVIVLHFVLPFYQNTLSSAELITAKILFYIMLFNMAITIPGHIFTSIINANEKFVFLKTVSLISIISQPIVVYCFLNLKSTVIFVALAHTICNLSIITINFYYSIFKLNTKIKLHEFNFKFIKEIFGFSFFIFLIVLMNLMYIKTGQVILGAIVGTAVVAVYSISVQLLMIYRSFSNAIFSVFLPYFSSISAKTDDMTEINNTFIKISRIEFLLLSLILSGFILYGQNFILQWVGKGFENSYIYTIIFMVGYLFISSQNMAPLILQAKNKHSVYAIIYVFTGIACFVLSIPMAYYLGALGCAITTMICLLLGQGIISNYYYYKIGIDVFRYIKNIFKLGIMVILSVLLGFLMKNFWEINSILTMLLQIIIFMILFTCIHWVFSLNNYEKNLLIKLFKRKLK